MSYIPLSPAAGPPVQVRESVGEASEGGFGDARADLPGPRAAVQDPGGDGGGDAELDGPSHVHSERGARPPEDRDLEPALLPGAKRRQPPGPGGRARDGTAEKL